MTCVAYSIFYVLIDASWLMTNLDQARIVRPMNELVENDKK